MSLDEYIKAIDAGREFMKSGPPASTTVQVSRLARDALIDIEAFTVL